ncbi:alpha/beta fold hydrolase [Roseomonas sp. BN140053]|uniref:alpha/beta fold hydrolase n=1 Tax=Roseomonas sp. BN140053 TaxID=3391898 RepID=UPI0039ECBFD5
MSASVAANGNTLAYDSFGDEASETILLIAGLGTQMIRWTDPFCAELAARGYRVVRFDNRDTGQSTHFTEHGAMDFGTLAAALAEGRRPDLAYTLDDMALDAVSLLDALSIRRAHVVGRSMGGMIAQIMASEHSSRVRSLTSIMSSSGNPGLPSAAPDAMALMVRPTPDPALDEAGFIERTVTFAQRIAGSSYPLDEEAHRTLIGAELRRGYVRGGFGRQLAAIALSGDRRTRLSVIRVPTLVVHGTDDALFPLACGEDTAASIPGAEWLPIQGMGHDLPPPLYRTIADAIERTARRSDIAALGE